MDLCLDMAVAEGYTSKSQIARRITEDWATRNMYCLACACDRLTAARNNAAVLDYFCPECEASYQLKSKKSQFGRTIANSAYDRKASAIETGRVPHYAFLQYSPALAQVTDLFVIPGHLFNLGMIRERKPLGPGAKRAGWVGSSILLGQVPPDTRVVVVSQGSSRHPRDIRADWGRYTFLEDDGRSGGGWTADILLCARRLSAETGSNEFSLQQFYERFLQELELRYLCNRNVEAKIRQQLQVLRDGGVLDFLGRGRYRLRA